MKSIGLIGGVGWLATIPAYRMLNEGVNERLGAAHSAEIVMYSVDYQRFKQHYHDGWDKIPGLALDMFRRALKAEPDCMLMACNTLHKAYDLIEKELDLKIPFFHAVRLTRDHLKSQGVGKSLFLGTAFTMKDDYFTKPLRDAGIHLQLPNEQDRATIQTIQGELSRGVSSPHHAKYFNQLCETAKKQGCDAVVLACTELPLAINSSVTDLNIIDPLVLQCRAAVDYALS